MIKFNPFLYRSSIVLLNSANRISTSSPNAKKPDDSKLFVSKVVPKIKSNVKYDNSLKSIKYITPVRSLKEYILTPKDLEKLPRYFSRSPYAHEIETQVFLRSDVERLAFEKHGGEESFLIKRKIMRDMERKAKYDIFNFRRALRYLSRSSNSSSESKTRDFTVFKSGSGRVIAFAIGINALNMAAKSVAWWYTGSMSMFSEMMHSAADTLNQVVLAFGIYSAAQKPDDMHPYGYFSMQNISSLISGVGIFFLGSGMSFYHGVQGLILPHEIESYQIALGVLAGSLLTEGTTLLMALQHTRNNAKICGFDSVKDYLLSGSSDPSVSVVLLEDAAAVLGILVASTAMCSTVYFGNPIPDALGAVGISFILAGVAAFIIRSNSALLLGKAIPIEEQEAIAKVIDSAKVVRGTYDIKATLIGNEHVRFKAEVDIDGRELTSRYLETLPPHVWLKEIEAIKTEEQALHFMLKHGDNIVNTLGAEINMIEQKIKDKFPKVKHIDIEIN